MSCIAYACNCMLEKSLLKFGADFESEYFVNLTTINRIFFHGEQMIPVSFDFFVGKVHDVINMYDGDVHFLVCYKCLLKLTNVFNISDKCYLKDHNDCILKLLTYLHERVDEKEIVGEYLFHYCDLCEECIFRFCNDFKGEFSAVFHIKLLS